MKTRPIIYQILPRLFGNCQKKGKPWGTLKENGVGKFNDITDKALIEIRSLGITHIWYTGIIEHATQTDYTDYGIQMDHPSIVKGKAGSAYAIKDYYDVDPDLADAVPNRMKEFDLLVNRTHKHKLKVLIDFVPNHVARQYHSDSKPKGIKDLGEDDNSSTSFDLNNNFYYLVNESLKVPDESRDGNKGDHYNEFPAKASGNDVFNASPSFYDWFETIKLNYGIDYQNNRYEFDPIPNTWHKMKDILLFWAGKKIDGFRCDMAEMVPVEFWEWAIQKVKEVYPEVIFIAEVYDPSKYREYIFTGGFDYLYDKVELYDTLKNIIQYHTGADAITHVWQRQEGIGDHMLRFLENHDEQRLTSSHFAGDMAKGIPMMAVTAFMHKGPVMIYSGQEVGEPAEGASGFSGDDGRTTIFDYWHIPEHQKWMNKGAFDGKRLSKAQKKLRQEYQTILEACNNFSELKEGQFFDLQYFNRNAHYTGYSERVYAFIRHSSSSALLIVTNFSGNTEWAHMKIPIEVLNLFIKNGQDKLIYDQKEIDINTLCNLEALCNFKVKLDPFSYQIIKIC